MNEQTETGKLYIVATPIGNSRDMSPRGKQILSRLEPSHMAYQACGACGEATKTRRGCISGWAKAIPPRNAAIRRKAKRFMG